MLLFTIWFVELFGQLHVGSDKELVPHLKHLIRCENFSRNLKLLILRQLCHLLDEQSLILGLCITFLIEERSCCADMLALCDLLLQVRLNLDDQ